MAIELAEFKKIFSESLQAVPSKQASERKLFIHVKLKSCNSAGAIKTTTKVVDYARK